MKLPTHLTMYKVAYETHDGGMYVGYSVYDCNRKLQISYDNMGRVFRFSGDVVFKNLKVSGREGSKINNPLDILVVLGITIEQVRLDLDQLYQENK